MRRRPTILAVLLTLTLALALALVACGGDDGDEEKAAPKGPTKQQDSAAIEQVLLAYGAAEGGDVCTFYASNQIESTGGLEECKSVNEDTGAAIFTVENVAVNGDEATAVITVKGQEDEVSTYGLTREGGDWKISDFPSDDDPQASGEAEPVAEEEPEQETALPDPEASARANVEELLAGFGEAKDAEVCDFFSDQLIQERGGLKSCQQYFEGKPALRSETVKLSLTVPEGKEDVLPGATAVIKSGVSGQNLYLQLNVLGSPLDPYGGWKITSQSD